MQRTPKAAPLKPAFGGYMRISTDYYVPSPRYKKDAALIIQYFCNLDSRSQHCELFAQGQCLHYWDFMTGITSRQCIYGEAKREMGYTRSAQKFQAFVAKAKAEEKQWPKLVRFGIDRIANIGEYVWLPYSTMEHCLDVPFVEKYYTWKRPFPFMKRVDFTPDVITTLLNFRPIALNGEEIFQYQRDSIPAFRKDLERWMPNNALAPDFEGQAGKLVVNH